ncbi:MAG: RsmB/NOP family class I SAM-dependent RNA methyltransferase [Calditrichaceae bacterium]|jgi:16S rRNA (cytosine1407-C5)-methyltransferase
MTKNQELNSYLSHLFGDDVESFLAVKPEKRAIRINTIKTTKADLIEMLNRLKVDFNELTFNPYGFILNDDTIPLSHTLDFFQGKFQYQGISSQIPALVLNPQPGENVLDIAAAPGSKSTQLADRMKNEGQLYLNDISNNRLQSLNVNVQRAGVLNEIILNMAGEGFGKRFPDYFDKILVDAPCTALGTLAGSPEVASWWSYDKLKKLSVTQKQLLISAFKALKPGGEMVYSTCSIAPEENEVLIQWLLDDYPVEIQDIDLKEKISCDDGKVEYDGQIFSDDLSKAIRVFPHRHEMEGFFVVKLMKLESTVKTNYSVNAKCLSTLSHTDPSIKNELDSLSQLWGIEQKFWKSYRFIITKNRIWMMCGKIRQVPSARLHNAGLLLAEKRLSGWKLTNQSVQILGERIHKRTITLKDEQVQELFSTGFIQISGLEYGYYVLERESKAIASVYWEKEKLQIRLPHVFRLAL